MADTREYVVPLRKEWMKVPRYKRSRKGALAVKEFIAKHMRVPDRDLDKVKLDVYLNNEIWRRGSKKPPAKIKVRATREGDIVRVELAEMPEFLKFNKAREERLHKKGEKRKESKEEVKEEKKSESEEGKEEGISKEKKEEEKKESVEAANLKLAEKTAKEQKHTVKTQSKQFPQRKTLKK